jgi:hypothetical protein
MTKFQGAVASFGDDFPDGENDSSVLTSCFPEIIFIAFEVSWNLWMDFHSPGAN